MKFPVTSRSARISEMFSSLQGEGTHLGQRHLFVRFEECHIHCVYCDELDKPGREYDIDGAFEEILQIDKEEGPHQFVSLTGGEPLLYIQFMKPLMEKLKNHGFRIHLETNGILWKPLQEVLELCDVIAMDMKPASVTKEDNYDEDHEKFLEVAKKKETFIKIIISPEININEFENQMKIVKRIAPKVPVLLVPISTDKEGHEDESLMQLLEQLQRVGGSYNLDMRIVPRFHKILSIR